MANPQKYSTLEVHQPDVSQLPEVVSHADGMIATKDDSELPEAIDTTLPEVRQEPNTNKRICGISRKAFWILFAGFLVITLGAAIGGGVGGALAAKREPQSTNTSHAPNGDDGILPNSRIAAINYTDASNTIHYRVFFQMESQALYQSDYNTSTREWTASPVSVTGNTTAIKALRRSDIAAHAYWHSSTDVDFRLYFMDENSSVREFYSNLTNPNWILGDGDAKLVAAFNSTLASYGHPCSVCDPSTFYVYQVISSGVTTKNLANRTGENQWPSSIIDKGFEVGNGSSIAVVPVQPVRDLPPKISIFMNNGYLVEKQLIKCKWSDTRISKSTSLESESGIAAITQDVDDVFYLQALTTTSNGIGLDTWNSTADSWTQSTFNPAFTNIVPNSPIAANQEGRIYMWQEGGNGSTLTEWKGSNDGHNVTFERIGAVGVKLKHWDCPRTFDAASASLRGNFTYA